MTLRRIKFASGLIAILSVLFIFAALNIDHAYACASCGSGGDEPLVLFPAEALKVHGSISITPQLASTGPDGTALQSAGPDRRIAATFAVGLAISPRSFLIVSESLVTNSRTSSSGSGTRPSSVNQSGIADPLVSGRYTLVMPQLSRPLIPQVQVLAGYRPAMVRSIHDSTDAHLLDVFGSGFDEIRIGTDLWMGMLPVKPGIAVSVTESVATRHNGTLLKPGTLVRTTCSLSGAIPAGDFGIEALPVKLSAGVTADRRGQATADRDRVEDSEQSVNGAFVSADFLAFESDSIKLTMARQGAFGTVKNSVASTNWTMAWARVLR